jgi:hypothetical protein
MNKLIGRLDGALIGRSDGALIGQSDGTRLIGQSDGAVAVACSVEKSRRVSAAQAYRTVGRGNAEGGDCRQHEARTEGSP